MNRAVLGRITLLIVLLAAIALAALYRDQLDVEAVTRWIGEAGPAAPLLFMALYALATVLFLPGSVMTLIGGALFGPLLGTFYNLTAATLGAAIAFLVARHLAADWVERKVAGRTRQLIDGVEAEGWRFVAFTRLVPLFPFNLLNYGLGLTRIPFSHYLLTSYICMLPGAFAYTYLGYVGREAVSGEQDIIQKVLLALAVLAFVGFLPRFIGRLRRGADITVEALQHQLNLPGPPLLLDVRERDEFHGEHGHIAGAINLPLADLEREIDQFSSHMKHPVALVCRREKRSVKAARLLSRHGFRQLHVVKGGMDAWHGAGLPVERNT